jgi:DNA adenine methylase
MRKPRSYAEVYNDLDGDAVNLFRVLRSDRAKELIEAVRLTPFSRDEFLEAYEATDDAIESARRLIVRSFMGFGSNAHTKPSGFRANSNRIGTTPAKDWANYPNAMAAMVDRLRGVVIERRDAIEVMTAHDGPETLHYVDPPYLPETRDAGTDYAHEMNVCQHRALLTYLRSVEGMVVLSGYPSRIYDDALHDWKRVNRRAMADGARERTEVLWISPKAVFAEGLFAGEAA